MIFGRRCGEVSLAVFERRNKAVFCRFDTIVGGIDVVVAAVDDVDVVERGYLC